MSKHHIEKVTCPSCHHEGDFEVWDSINTVLDPAMKEKVLNQSIFLYTCPNCGETFRLNYPTLYHQMEDLVMIYLVPESEVEKTYEIFYEKNALEYVVIDFKETANVYVGKKDITTKEKMANIIINSNLWNAMVDAQADPMLAVTLSDIYAWSIDFYGIAKGDSVRVLYEQSYVEDKPLQDFNVKAAIFTNSGKDFYAIPFEQNEKLAYFDEEGNSLQKTFLKAPLKYSRISSGFSNNRFHPVLKRYRAHHGVDYAAPTGTEVHTIGDGVVVKKAFQANGGGNYVTIKHNSVYTTTYMHLSKFAKGIQPGKRVKQGDVIGYVGSTGLATGPHLDFRVYKNGTPINPLKMSSPPKEPISAENMPRFIQMRDSLVKILKNNPKILTDEQESSNQKS